MAETQRQGLDEDQHDHPVDYRTLFRWFRAVLGPESGYYWMAIIYGVGISLLTLALPISVQMLIDTVANTGLVQPVVVLSSVLFVLLLLSGLFVALRAHVMELFARKIYARLTAEIALRATHSQVTFFLEGKRDSLFNRFFDIMILQANVPALLTGAFNLIVQAAIGFVVVSLYHPFLAIYTVIIITVIAIVWIIWGTGAIRTAVAESYAKYETAHHLEGLAEYNDYYRAHRHLKAAIAASDKQIEHFIRRNRRHFRYSFSQIISLLILYAAGSALLLGIGGWLVIQGQLTLGQLVAAELIMSAILFGISQFGFYLDQFYEVCAAVEKLSAFFRIPLEEDHGGQSVPQTPPEIRFDNVMIHRRDGEEIRIDVTLPAGAHVTSREWQIPAQRAFLSLLQAYERPIKGWVTLGGVDVGDIDFARLRAGVMVVDRTDIAECTINSYLREANPAIGTVERVNALKLVGMAETVERLSLGMDTPILPSGWPLSPSETLRLKLAKAVVTRPRVIALSEIYDLVERRYLDPILEYFAKDPETTVIRFTDDEPTDWATHTLLLYRDRQALSRHTGGGQPR